MDRSEPATTLTAAPGYKRPWTLVIVLMVIFSYAFMDITIIILLVDPIKASLHLSDGQIGLLLGFAFAGFYALATLPAGYLVDRRDRRMLIGIASITWAAMTLVCASANGFWQIFAGRAGVGLAEAMIIPASFSLIRDAVPERARGMAFSIYAMSPILGASVGLIGGGALLHAIKSGALSGFGPLAAVTPWRDVMGLAGLLGLPLSLLLLMVREPPRDTAGIAGSKTIAGPPVLAHIRAHAGAYALLVGYAAFSTMMTFGQGAWLPTMLGRKWSLPPDRIGPMVGVINLSCGLLGLVLTSFLLRYLAAQRRDIIRFGALATFCAGAGLVGAAMAPSLAIALTCSGFAQFFIGVAFPVGATTLTQIAPEQLMGRVSAGYLLCQTLLGQSLGPLLIAFAGTQLFTGIDRLPLGFALMMAVFGAVSAACALGLHRAVARSPGSGLNARDSQLLTDRDFA